VTVVSEDHTDETDGRDVDSETERERDPFDSFEGYDDRDSDPFQYMDDDSGPDSRQGSSASGPAGGSAPGPDRSGDPLGNVDVSDEDPFESNASAFDRSGVDRIDPDNVWERLTADTDEDGDAEPEPAADAVGATVGSAADAEDDVVQVSKHSYCEGCEYFSPPPDVRCGHEGTEIIEFVDIDDIRIANCPVVEEQRELDESV
jgi:hypothetical protein